MKVKGFAILAALATLGFAGNAVSQETKTRPLDDAITVCAAMKQAWMKGQKDKVIRFIASLDEPTRNAVEVVCTAYSRGFDDGQQSVV